MKYRQILDTNATKCPFLFVMFISNLCRQRLSFCDDCLSLKIPVENCYKCYAQEIVKAQRKRMAVKDGLNSAKFFVVTYGGQCIGGPHKGIHVNG